MHLRTSKLGFLSSVNNFFFFLFFNIFFYNLHKLGSLTDNFMQYMMISREKIRTEEGKKRIYYLSWWIFDTISKSLVLASKKAGNLNSKDRRDRFTKQHSNVFSKVVKKLWDILTNFLCENICSKSYEGELILSQNMAIFVHDLFGIFDRGLPVDLSEIFIVSCDKNIEKYPEKSEIISLLRLEYLKITADHEHWVNLNLPLPLDFSLSSPNSLKILQERHFLAYIYINNSINEIIKYKSSNVSRYAINNITLLLSKHDFDFTFNSPHSNHLPKIDKDLNVEEVEDDQNAENEEKIENLDSQIPVDKKRKLLASIYSPLLLLWISNWPSTEKWRTSSSKDQKREFYISILWLLKNLGIENLRNWWKTENVSYLFIFLKTLQEAISCFEFDPKETPSVTNWTHSTKDIFTKMFNSESKSKTPTKFYDRNKNTAFIEEPQSITERTKSQNFQISLTILNIVEVLINDYNEIFKSDPLPSELFTQVLTTLITFSKTSQSSQFYSHWFSVLYKFVDSQKKFIFLQKNKLLNKICKFTLNFCSYRCDLVRSEAASFMYNLVLVKKKKNHFFRLFYFLFFISIFFFLEKLSIVWKLS